MITTTTTTISLYDILRTDLKLDEERARTFVEVCQLSTKDTVHLLLADYQHPINELKSQLKEDFIKIDNKFETQKKDYDSKFERLRSDMNHNFETQKNDFEVRFNNIDNLLVALKNDYDTKFNTLRSEIKDQFSIFRLEINDQFSNFRLEINDQFSNLRLESKDNISSMFKWFLASFITLVLAILGLYATIFLKQ